jgi:hypothetical protein
MTGFRQFGASTTIDTVITERRNDAAVVDHLVGNKVQGRDRTGVRTVPTAQTDVINGDIKGDYVYDFSNEYVYKLTSNSGTLQWVRIIIDAIFP